MGNMTFNEVMHYACALEAFHMVNREELQEAYAILYNNMHPLYGVTGQICAAGSAQTYWWRT